MMTARATLAATLALALPVGAHAQTMDDLNRLSEATWQVTQTTLTTPSDLLAAVQPYFPSASVNDLSPRNLNGWEGDAYEWKASFPDYSPLDGIRCAVLTTSGVERFAPIAALPRRESRPLVPDVLAPFWIADIPFETLPPDMQLQTCIGAFHPRNDRLEVANWTPWYDSLERMFRADGLTTTREASTSASYRAGFLSGERTDCPSYPCVIRVVPWNVELVGMNTNQATISVFSVVRTEP